QAPRLRVLHAPRSRRRGHRLRDLPRPDRHDGGRDADEAAVDELVPRLPQEPGAQQASGLRGHQYEVDGAEGRGGSLRPAGEGASRSSPDRLLRVPPMNETYWRSLGQLNDTPSFREQLTREFPEGASELPEGVSRREMLLLLGASLSLAGLASCR